MPNILYFAKINYLPIFLKSVFLICFYRNDTILMTTNAKSTVLPPCTNRAAFLGGVGGPPPIEDSSYKDESAAGVLRDAVEVRASEQKYTFTGRPETHTLAF